MANFKTHLITGSIAGSVGVWLLARTRGENITLTDLLKGGAIGAAFSVLPDGLEPSTSPHHRSFFHSYATLAGEAYGAHRLLNSSLDIEVKKATLAALFGYGSHLLLDSRTPAGLPFMG